MGAYQDKTRETVDNASTWAGQATRFWLESYVAMVERASAGTGTADSAVQDLSALVATGARDMARAWSTCIAMGNALLDVDVSPPGPGGGDGDAGAGGGTG